jgi:hypothetical protein
MRQLSTVLATADQNGRGSPHIDMDQPTPRQGLNVVTEQQQTDRLPGFGKQKAAWSGNRQCAKKVERSEACDCKSTFSKSLIGTWTGSRVKPDEKKRQDYEQRSARSEMQPLQAGQAYGQIAERDRGQRSDKVAGDQDRGDERLSKPI